MRWNSPVARLGRSTGWGGRRERRRGRRGQVSWSHRQYRSESHVRWWDLRTLSQTASLDLKDPISSMELAHGGGTLSVTAGNKVHFLDILRQHPPVTVPLPHPPTSASLHPFSRDRFVVGSANDPWVRVYDLDTGAEKEVYKGHHGPVLCASYSPDGEVYASGSEDGELSIPRIMDPRSSCHRHDPAMADQSGQVVRALANPRIDVDTLPGSDRSL